MINPEVINLDPKQVLLVKGVAYTGLAVGGVVGGLYLFKWAKETAWPWIKEKFSSLNPFNKNSEAGKKASEATQNAKNTVVNAWNQYQDFTANNRAKAVEGIKTVYTAATSDKTKTALANAGNTIKTAASNATSAAKSSTVLQQGKSLLQSAGSSASNSASSMLKKATSLFSR